MLPKLYNEIDKEADVKIRKFLNGDDVSHIGAFRFGSVIDFEVSVSRNLGMTTPVLRICRDGCLDKDLPMIFEGSDNISDVYCLSVDTKKLCDGAECGLFYYEIVLVRGAETLYTDAYNNVDFVISSKESSRFRLLVFEKDYKTPEKFGEGVMYQIFTDRFYKGKSERASSINVRHDAIMNNNWDNGIPQYAKNPGEPLENNMFFGGNLYGVAEKLDYLKELGVSVIYLCPIFEAYSNHKYDTGNYFKVDDMFGGDEALKLLISQAKQRDISIVLDGVFNHTGDDSVYFNRKGRYGKGGAYNDKNSPYANWYYFKNYPDEYESWWGIDILPRLNHSNEECRRFFTGDGGVVQKYMYMGIGGWRLDVADELNDEFLDEFRTAVKKSSDGQAVIIGEVWENAVDKQSYGSRRRYFQGRQLDSVMNYPLRSAILSFCEYADSDTLYNTLVEIYSSYPRQVSDELMNIIGTHDTERILTVLGRDIGDEDRSMSELAMAKLSKKQRQKGIALLKIAATIQYTVYGIPSLYYGDEVGLEGYRDPFCRMPFPWAEIDKSYRCDILNFYKTLGRIRNEESAFKKGDFYVVDKSEGYICYVREDANTRIIISANRGKDKIMQIPDGTVYRDLINNTDFVGCVKIKSNTAVIFKEIKK